jgi:hypothetical protein
LSQQEKSARAKVGYKLPNEPAVTWAFPSDDNLRALGIREEYIKTISFSDYYPGNAYEELPIAGCEHPAIGSFTAHITMKDGRKAAVSDIYYQDIPGHRSMPYPHWNHQTRLQWNGASCTLKNEPFEHHAHPKTDWIDLIREDPTGRKVDRLKWRKQDEVLKK